MPESVKSVKLWIYKNYINFHQDIAQTPKDHISINIIGPYSTTSQDYLMTTPISNKKTIVAVLLISQIILKFGFSWILEQNLSQNSLNTSHTNSV